VIIVDAGDLKIFRTVAREGSISKAALALNYVQSNVTTRIRQLESQLQVPLFHRTNRGMVLTPAGDHLLEYADKILDLLHEAELSTQTGSKPAGKLRLGSIETAASSFLAPFLAKYHSCYPEVQTSLVTGGTHELNQRVMQHDLQGALVYGPVDHPELNYIKVFDEELVLIAEPGLHQMAEVLGKPMLFFEIGCTHRTQAEAFLHSRGVHTLNVMEFGTLNTILSGVSAGIGVSLLPRSSVVQAELRGEVSVIALPEPYCRLEVGLVHARSEHLSAALRGLLEMMTTRPETKKENEI